MSSKVFLLLLASAFIAIENSHGQNRDPRPSWRIVPGTKWCGKGSIAKSYNDLGRFANTDRCCRTHDKHCSARIQPLKRKYGLLNLSWKVASYCDCEVRFKKCLDRVNNFASRGVTALYFNLIKPRCIRFKFVTKCVRRSWWRCTKKKRVRTAYFVSLNKVIR